MKNLNFAHRVAIVTGAGRGLGRAHALILAARNCRVVVSDIPNTDGTPGPAHDVVREIEEAGGIAVACEHSILSNAGDVIQTAIDAFGQLDILINNAGVTDHACFDELDNSRFEGQLAIHLFAAADLIRAAWPHLAKSGSGRILNTISGGIYGNAGISNYTAAKGALLGFSRSIAFEAAPHGMTVNCLFPNARTRLTDGMGTKIQEFLDLHFAPERIAAFTAAIVHQDTEINNEMFEAGGGTVARVRFAHEPFIKSDVHTPEAWASTLDEVLAGAPLTPFDGALDVIDREFRMIDPSFDIKSVTLLEGVD